MWTKEFAPGWLVFFSPLCPLPAGHVAFREFTGAKVLPAGSGFVGYLVGNLEFMKN